MDERPAGGGVDETDEGAPGETVLHDGGWSLPSRRPDATQDRLEAPSPMRCSSVAHTSTVALGKAVATACSSGLNFF